MRLRLHAHHRGAGLFSQLNKIITVMESRGDDIHVDWSRGTLYGRYEDGNVFEHLFHQLAPPGPHDIHINGWPHLRYTWRNIAAYYPVNDWRLSLHRCWRKLIPIPALAAEVDAFIGPHGSAVTAIHIRNCRIGSECTDGLAPTLATYEAALATATDKVFLATDNDEAVRYFRERLGDRLLVRDIPRSPDMKTELHLSRPQSVRDAQDCLVDALVMARCSHLIHSVSNVATAVLCMNPMMPHTFVEHGQMRTFAGATEGEQISDAQFAFIQWSAAELEKRLALEKQPG